MGGTNGDGLVLVPADEAGWSAVETVLASCSDSRRCWCQRYKLARRESFAGFPAEERTHRLRAQTGDATAEAGESTTGLVALLDEEPVGWCAVEPRLDYDGLLRGSRLPWQGRSEDKADPGVWAVTCFVTRIGHRRQGVATALAAASVQFARGRGATAVEGYPLTSAAAILNDLHPGTLAMFTRAGFVEVIRPTLKRAVVRRDL